MFMRRGVSLGASPDPALRDPQIHGHGPHAYRAARSLKFDRLEPGASMKRKRLVVWYEPDEACRRGSRPWMRINDLGVTVMDGKRLASIN